MSALRRRIEALMGGERPRPFDPLAAGLNLAAGVYGGVGRLRAALYRRGVLRARRLPCPVIAIGNLTVGGTGKTPMAIHVAGLLQQLGYRVAVISRGYRGLAEKTGGVVSDGANLRMTAAQAGDEPYLMALLLPGVPVVVGRSRLRAGLCALAAFGVDVLVLDDAYQHLQLARDLNLLLLDQAAPFGNGQVLPRGVLREPISALTRADAVVFTRAAGNVGHGAGGCPATGAGDRRAGVLLPSSAVHRRGRAGGKAPDGGRFTPHRRGRPGRAADGGVFGYRPQRRFSPNACRAWGEGQRGAILPRSPQLQRKRICNGSDGRPAEPGRASWSRPTRTSFASSPAASGRCPWGWSASGSTSGIRPRRFRILSGGGQPISSAGIPDRSRAAGRPPSADGSPPRRPRGDPPRCSGDG